jgi:hypothetical protein
MDNVEAYRQDTDEQVNEGDIITDFRGDKWVFVSIIPGCMALKLAHKEGKRILVDCSLPLCLALDRSS